jgi:hypothetical protein
MAANPKATEMIDSFFIFLDTPNRYPGCNMISCA